MRPRLHPTAPALSAKAAPERDEPFRKRNLIRRQESCICNYRINSTKPHLNESDEATRKSHGRAAHRKLLSRQTRDTTIKGGQVRASEHEPQYIVESDNGGKASHKPGALTKE